MKKTLLILPILLFTITSADECSSCPTCQAAAAQHAQVQNNQAQFAPTTTPAQSQPCPQPKLPFYNLTYVKLGGGAVSVGEGTEGAIMAGIGKRLIRGSWAADLSAQFGSDFFQIPRIQLLYYPLGPHQRGFYVGGGLSYGGHFVHSHKFLGLYGEFTAGVELMKQRRMCTFIELNVSQPIVASRHYKHPSGYVPIITVALGVAF